MVYAAGLVLWLTVGLLPILVDTVPAIADAVGQLAAGSGPLAEPAGLLMHPTIPMTGVSGNGLLEYAFSLLNLVLGVLLIVRRPNDVVPRLLALGLLGTAATFNLPSHEAFHVLGSPWPIALLHFTFHIVSGVAYLWAVALFPDGRLPERIAVTRRTLTVAAVTVTATVSLICWWSDFLAHPQFFVIFFGILIPVVGVGAQTLRLTEQTTPPTTRRAARLLIGALLPALALAVIWCLARGLATLGVGISEAASQAADRLQDLFPAVFAIVPVVLFAGVLRYRLFDIDRLLSRVLVYGLIVLGSGLVYLVAVVTGSALVGGASWWTVVVLALAAVALEPAWSVAQRWANRVVFGQDLGPMAAMRTLISGLEQGDGAAELDQLVDVSVRATRAVRARLWLVHDDGDTQRWALRASAPADPAGSPRPVDPVLVPGRHWPVVHKGVRLGALIIELGTDESLPAGERALLSDLAAHAGLLVHNAVLAEQLARHVADLGDRANQLTVARRRLVAAQDRERRGIERDLHDGAQQTLVAVMLGMRMATADNISAQTKTSMLRQLNRELDASRTELTEIAAGQLPAAFRDGGLQGGLAKAVQTARRTGLTVDLRVDLSGLGTSAALTDDAAAAVYFCCSEALQNVAKYAHATHVSVEVTTHRGELVFAVGDDGKGLDPTRASDDGGLHGLDDRASLHGGWIAIDSSPGGGTRVHGAIPAFAEPVPVREASDHDEPVVDAASRQPVGAGPTARASENAASS